MEYRKNAIAKTVDAITRWDVDTPTQKELSFTDEHEGKVRSIKVVFQSLLDGGGHPWAGYILAGTYTYPLGHGTSSTQNLRFLRKALKKAKLLK